VGTIQISDIDVEIQRQECHQNVKVHAIQSIPISALVQFGVSIGEVLPTGENRRLGYVSTRVFAEIGLACVGIALLGTAIAANQRFLD